jgi:hypothetical protein
MSSPCTLLVRFTFSLLALAPTGMDLFDRAANSPAPQRIEMIDVLESSSVGSPGTSKSDTNQDIPCIVRGVLPAGSQIEFRAPGSSDRKSAATGDKGEYSVSLDAGRYEITWVQSSGKKFSDTVWLSGPEVQLNAETASGSGGGSHASGQEYDLLADWRVTDRDGHGTGPSQVMLAAELTSGRIEKLSVWALSSLGDEEKETAAPLLTTPDGRILFRIPDSRLRPDRVVALVVSVKGPGGETVNRRMAPLLEFSASGHLHAVYPDDLAISLEKPAGKP